jgi:hypothetical protein
MIPEFTAELALARHRSYYIVSKTPAGGETLADIVPQANATIASRTGGPDEAMSWWPCPGCIQIAGRLICCG